MKHFNITLKSIFLRSFKRFGVAMKNHSLFYKDNIATNKSYFSNLKNYSFILKLAIKKTNLNEPTTDCGKKKKKINDEIFPKFKKNIYFK